MPLPFIFVALAVGAGTVGTVKTIEGLDDMSRAKSIGKNAESRYSAYTKRFQAVEGQTQQAMAALGHARIKASAKEMREFIHEFRRLANANQSVIKELERVGIDLGELQAMEQLSMKASTIFGTGVKAISSSTATYFGALGLTSALASASTGTAISSLGGVAATNATLAWWGGGSLAAGGGGMALGTTMLGVVTVAPALAIGGFVIAKEGKKALRKARKYEADVDKACAEIDSACTVMNVVQVRCQEIERVIVELSKRLAQLTRRLRCISSVRTEKSKREFHQAAQLAKALSEVLTVQVVNRQGMVTAASKQALVKAKKLQ